MQLAEQKRIISEELNTLRLRIIDNMKRNKQIVTGKTAQSLAVEVDEWGGRLMGNVPVIPTLETGRKAGRVPRGFASIIYQWMQDKGIHGDPIPYVRSGKHKYSAQERGDRSMAAAIAYTIANKGSRLHRIGGRNDVYSTEIPKTIAALHRRLPILLMSEIKSLHINLPNEIIEG